MKSTGAMLREWYETVSLESLLTSPHGFGLATASPLQRAICRIAEGRPLDALANLESVRNAIGDIGGIHVRPFELAIVAGVRTGKSLLAACVGVHAAFRCDVSRLGPGEIPRVAIVSTSRDNADVVFSHVRGRVHASPMLRRTLIAEGADWLTIRHPSGRPVEICVVAGSRAGSSLVARWMAAVVFDEYARMLGSAADGVVNWRDCRASVLRRMLPGGYLMHITSPWAPFGPAYEHVSTSWGTPSRELVVVRARADELNPDYWTPERVESARRDPDTYRTDVLAEFSSPEEALFSAEHLSACTRASPEVLPPVPGASYSASMDPATRGNGWSFMIATRDGTKRRIALAREWVGSRAAPLSPRAVLGEIAALCREYGITSVDTDQWSGDALADIAREFGISLFQWPLTDKQRTERYLTLRTIVATGGIDLPPNAQLRTDLLRVRKRVTAGGASIVLPATSDGRHCDYAPATMLVMARYLDDVAPTRPNVDAEVERMRADAARRYGRRDDVDNWSDE